MEYLPRLNDSLGLRTPIAAARTRRDFRTPMPMSPDAGAYDVAVIGGGIVGAATAFALTERRDVSVILLEAEDRLASHQSGRNSGVVHSGLYYKPGSWRARLCVEGRGLLYGFCEQHGVAHERCGKLVVATRESELPALEDLERRGRENGLRGLRRLRPEEIREYEPHAAGRAGLYVADTGIVDFPAVAEAMARRVRDAGGVIWTGARLTRFRRAGAEMMLETLRGGVRCRNLIGCAGLHSDRVARLCGVEPGVRIVPFRGEYYELVPDRAALVRHLIYPVPDARFPFLGVHFTRMIGGDVEAGPNAVLAFKREGYDRASFSLADTSETLAYPGFWRLAIKHWRYGASEWRRSLSKRAFVGALRRLVPELSEDDVRPGRAGVRAMALERDGSFADDFRIVEGERMIHVLNAPSPAATASISIGRWIAGRAAERFDLARRPA